MMMIWSITWRNVHLRLLFNKRILFQDKPILERIYEVWQVFYLSWDFNYVVFCGCNKWLCMNSQISASISVNNVWENSVSYHTYLLRIYFSVDLREYFSMSNCRLFLAMSQYTNIQSLFYLYSFFKSLIISATWGIAQNIDIISINFSALLKRVS